MNARAKNFAVANEESPVVYGSVDAGKVTYRLADGKVFNLNTAEARQVPRPRWAFIQAEWDEPALQEHRREEAEILRRVLAEALLPSGERQ